MKKLLLLSMLVLASAVLALAHGQKSEQQGGPQQAHEAHFKVVDALTMQPVSHAGIYNHAGKQLGITDDQGTVVLSIPASATETYTIRATGFNIVDIQLDMASQAKADYEVLLPAVNRKSPAQEDGAKVYVKQDPSTYRKPKGEDAAKLEFAVQLAASSKPITDMSSLKSWEELGPLYIHNENGMYKVRLGPFNSQDQAKQVLLQAKERGKKDAFIVIQKGLDNYTPEGYVKKDLTETSPMPSTPAPQPVNPAPSTPVTQPSAHEPTAATAPSTVVDENVEYKVRLVSYLKPGGFNTKDIDQYGTLESYRKGEWTILMIGGFKTEKDAIHVKDEVVKKGYNDAIVVTVRDGILQLDDK